ncbi:hypothetical protein ACIP4N_30205, partial [Streptomyces sp. NPDC088864]
ATNARPTTSWPSPASPAPSFATADSPNEMTSKGAFEADHYGGLRAALSELLDTGGMNLAALDLIDVKRFREQVMQAAAGVPMPLAHIEQALAADAWLHTLTCTPQPAWVAGLPRRVE